MDKDDQARIVRISSSEVSDVHQEANCDAVVACAVDPIAQVLWDTERICNIRLRLWWSGLLWNDSTSSASSSGLRVLLHDVTVACDRSGEKLNYLQLVAKRLNNL
eukprot:scaffold1805_cov104-Cylindrotheca_fusiformis.AAC.6